MEAIRSLLWSDSISEEELAARVAELREQINDDPDRPAREVDLKAFLVARGYDAEAAAAMWIASQEWRKKTFPIQRTEGIERILKSSRYRSLGFNKEETPRMVVVFDAQWGKFLEGESEEDLLNAFLLWFEEQLAIIDSAEAPAYSFIHIAVGGPPPLKWGRQLTQVLEANYPERLHKAVMFPVPWLLRRVINGMLWFVPSRTRDKFDFASDAAGLADLCMIEESSLSTDILETTMEKAWEAIGDSKNGLLATMDLWQKNEQGDDQTFRAGYVAAWRTESLTVEIAEPIDWLQWSCGVDKGYDVGLQVSFVPKDSATEAVDLRSPDLFEDFVEGEQFRPGTVGKLVFEFDNTYSWINGKNVYAQVVLHKTQLVGDDSTADSEPPH